MCAAAILAIKVVPSAEYRVQSKNPFWLAASASAAARRLQKVQSERQKIDANRSKRQRAFVAAAAAALVFKLGEPGTPLALRIGSGVMVKAEKARMA
jgi:hypothetical protein